MGLNISKGNMYEWITHTWNPIKGKCPHDCSYCYMKRWGNQPDLHFDEKELNTDLGLGNFIFVGSSIDMFAWIMNHEWVFKTLEHCMKFDNTYLFQSKNPMNFRIFPCPEKTVYCTTIETNRIYPDVMRNAPRPELRAKYLGKIHLTKKYVTIEPIMDFDLTEFIELIKRCEPIQVNIGADSGGNKLPEPSENKILELIEALETFTIVKVKKNLNRLCINENKTDHIKN